jgi:Uma2 family endonuclease
MSILSEVAEIRDTVAPMSVDFYHASTELGWIDENVELLRGIPLRKMSKSPFHEYLVRFFLGLIDEVLPTGFFVTKESPLTTSDSEPEPDLMVIKGKESDFRDHHPTTAELVVEVSINTQERDRSKAAIYAEAQVAEYWLVLPEKKEILIYTQSNGREYEQRRTISNGKAISSVIEGLQVDVPEVFA